MDETAPFETKADYVYRALRDAIVNGRIESGERLRLTSLAQKLRTSEMPVREALRMLQRDGLVHMETHRGATVASVDWQHVVEAVEVRMYLEVFAIAEAASLHTETSLADARNVYAEMDSAVENDEPDAFSEANRRFHTILYAPAPNRLLRQQIHDLWDLVWRERSRSLFRLDPGRAQAAQWEHAAMLVAIGRRDPDAASQAAMVHRTNTLAAWRAAAPQVHT